MPDENTRKAGRLLIEWRTARGAKMTETAMTFGISPALFSAFERGDRRPGLTNALRIAEHTDNAVPVTAWAPVAEAKATGRVPSAKTKLRKAG